NPCNPLNLLLPKIAGYANCVAILIWATARIDLADGADETENVKGGPKVLTCNDYPPNKNNGCTDKLKAVADKEVDDRVCQPLNSFYVFVQGLYPLFVKRNTVIYLCETREGGCVFLRWSGDGSQLQA
ncbi:MAG: hypothetical protein JW883_07620, partial [Deltaproteobacteria bacterium]|nr:hypothetical protein [Deltaproteobacteria bacterium]